MSDVPLYSHRDLNHRWRSVNVFMTYLGLGFAEAIDLAKTLSPTNSELAWRQTLEEVARRRLDKSFSESVRDGSWDQLNISVDT